MLRKPVPTGVVIGALSAQRVRRTLSITASGSGVPVRSITSTPASCTSQLIFTPVASTQWRAAAASSGPVPSPVINVTSCAMMCGSSKNAVIKGGIQAENTSRSGYQMRRGASNGATERGATPCAAGVLSNENWLNEQHG